MTNINQNILIKNNTFHLTNNQIQYILSQTNNPNTQKILNYIQISWIDNPNSIFTPTNTPHNQTTINHLIHHINNTHL